jgi:nicotinate-nucleotide adenylyltransferase
MMPSIAILGGTFDPLHIGHLAIAEDVRHNLQVERVIFIPAAQQPFKTDRQSTPAADRLAMVQLGIADNPTFAVSDIEVRRGGISYTVETVEQLHKTYPAHEFFFIVGVDAASALPDWHDVNRLLTLCTIVIVERPGYELDFEALCAQLPAARTRVIRTAGPALDISASELRERLFTGRPVRYHLPAAVRRYIEERRLYRDDAHDATHPASDDR